MSEDKPFFLILVVDYISQHKPYLAATFDSAHADCIVYTPHSTPHKAVYLFAAANCTQKYYKNEQTKYTILDFLCQAFILLYGH